MVILSLYFIFSFLSTSYALAAPSLYDITATYYEAEHQIIGSEKITLTNDGEVPLSEIYLFLYPNLYSKKNPNINPAYYKKAYPVQFNPGEMRIFSISDEAGTRLSYAAEASNMVVKITLPVPIPPKNPYTFLVYFVTKIPQKYGIFGYYRELVALQGGWHPYLPPLINGKWNLLRPPEVAQFKIHFTVKERFYLLASAPLHLEKQSGEDQTFFFEATLPFFSLAIGLNMVRLEETVGNIHLIYHVRSRDKIEAKQVMRVAKEAVDYFLKDAGPMPTTLLQFSEAHLYQDVVGRGAHMLYLNTNLFKVISPLKRFHEAAVAKGVFSLLWRERLLHEEAWVTEGIAQIATEQFIKEKYGRVSHMEKWLKPFAFIPLVDDILYSKEIPLRQIYFKETVAPYVNEELQFFNHPRPEGTTIFTKLTNLLGQKAVDAMVFAYLKEIELGGRPAFRDIASQVSGKDLHWFFDQWLEENPVLDFGIDRIDREKVEGGHRTTIVVKKLGKGIEPLGIYVHEKNGPEQSLIWDGRGDSHEAVVATSSPVDIVELDPGRQSSDPNRSNNRNPIKWKVVLDRLKFSYNLNTHNINYSAGALYQPVYDDTKRYRLYFKHTDLGNEGRMEYARTLQNRHTVTGGVSYAQLEAASGQSAGETAGIVHLGYALGYPSSPLLSYYIQKLTGKFPNASISFEYSQRVTEGSDDNLLTAKVDLRKIVSFSNYHEIGVRFFAGESFGELFQNSRFFLGGDEGLRGFKPLQYEGNHIGFISTEYRFPIYYETELQFGSLALTHTLQGAFFIESGNVTDSKNVFEFSNYRSDAGVGIRWQMDGLGFYPIIARIDIARPLPISHEGKNLYYLSVGQPF